VGAPLTSPVADNIVHMRALYGLDDGVGDASVTIKNGGVNVAGDGLVDRFVTLPPSTPFPRRPGSPSSPCALQSSPGVRFRKRRRAPEGHAKRRWLPPRGRAERSI